MNEIVDVKEEDLPIIEVPLELRGLSDEEIIRQSEKVLREVSGKRKKGERRPSKRDRQAAKEQESHSEAVALFEKSADQRSEQKKEIFLNAFTEKSPSYSTFTPEIVPAETIVLREDAAVHKSPVEPVPSSGRVLKASFGAKIGEKPKAVIVSAADLAFQKAEERAKKIREALFAKRTTSPEEAQVKRPRGRPRKNQEEPQEKRPRGRPRKNPVPEQT